MEYKVENTITAKEYNELRSSIGQDSKDENIIETALQNSVVVKKVTFDNQTIGMARAIGDGLNYLMVIQSKQNYQVVLKIELLKINFQNY